MGNPESYSLRRRYTYKWDGYKVDILTYIKKLEETIEYAHEIITDKTLTTRNPHDTHSQLPIENAVKNIKENK